MTKREIIKIFEERKVRTVWDDKEIETVTNCHALKLRAADGKMRMTTVGKQDRQVRHIVRKSLRLSVVA